MCGRHPGGLYFAMPGRPGRVNDAPSFDAPGGGLASLWPGRRDDDDPTRSRAARKWIILVVCPSGENRGWIRRIAPLVVKLEWGLIVRDRAASSRTGYSRFWQVSDSA